MKKCLPRKCERQRKSLKTVVRSLEQKRVRTAGRCLHLRATDSVFCSRDCWNQARQEQKKADREAERGTHYYRQRACAVCGHSYWPTHSQQEFCSEECRRINHNRKILGILSQEKNGKSKTRPRSNPNAETKGGQCSMTIMKKFPSMTTLTGLDYNLVNDHYLPNLTAAAPAEQHPTGRWGRLHKTVSEGAASHPV